MPSRICGGIYVGAISGVTRLSDRPATRMRSRVANLWRRIALNCPVNVFPIGGRMMVIETFERGRAPRASSLGEIRIDTS